jgi:PAS domain S-box-containing protein
MGGLAGILRAILLRGRANEHALLESRRALQQVIDNAPVALFSIDSAGVLTLATGNALKGYGERAGHLVGRNIRDVLKESTEFLAGVEAALEGRPGQLIANFEHGDLDIRLLPVLEDGRVTSVSGVAIDVTERRLAAQVRRESEAKSRFLATMSHEVRTPLNSVLGFAELLQDPRRGSLNDIQQRYVANITASGKHLLSIINDVLDMSRIAAGEIEVVVRPVAVDEAIAEAVAKVRPLAERKGLTLSVEAADRPVALADPLRLQQIVLNLLSNAIKFTTEGGRVAIGVRSIEHFIDVEVSDTGIGVASEHLERIFEEYCQLEGTSDGEQEGTGLGLAVSRRLAELMSATLTVVSVVGQGSVFRLRLPASSFVPAENPTGGDQGSRSPESQPDEIAGEAARA